MQQFRNRLWWSRPTTQPLQVLQWNVLAGMYFRQLGHELRSPASDSSDSAPFSSTKSVIWSGSSCLTVSVWPSRFSDDRWWVYNGILLKVFFKQTMYACLPCRSRRLIGISKLWRWNFLVAATPEEGRRIQRDWRENRLVTSENGLAPSLLHFRAS